MTSQFERYAASAPMRVDFAGGYTDVAPFTEDEGGAVTNLAVEIRTRVDLSIGGAGVCLASRDLREELIYGRATEMVYDGRLDLFKAALNMLPVVGALRLESRSDGPPASGLGSSGALGVAAMATLAEARQDRYDPSELAELAYTAEAEELRIRGGRQDQYAAALGGLHLLTFDGGETTARRLDPGDDVIAAIERHLIVAYLGESRLSGLVHERVWDAYGRGDQRVRSALLHMRDCAHQAADAILAGDLAGLGGAMDRNWIRQRELAAEIETPRMREVDALVRPLRPLGLKACGAGGGGCMLVLADDPRPVRTALLEAGVELLNVAAARIGVRSESPVSGTDG